MAQLVDMFSTYQFFSFISYVFAFCTRKKFATGSFYFFLPVKLVDKVLPKVPLDTGSSCLCIRSSASSRKKIRLLYGFSSHNLDVDAPRRYNCLGHCGQTYCKKLYWAIRLLIRLHEYVFTI